MDINQHPTLLRAIERRDEAMALVKQLSEFINIYKELNDIPAYVDAHYAKTYQEKKEIRFITAWVDIKRVAREVLKDMGLIENAATFLKEFEKRGYSAKKEAISACLTQSKDEFSYDKENGGWSLKAIQESGNLFVAAKNKNTQQQAA